MGRATRSQGIRLDDEPHHKEAGLDTQKKSLGAAERNEEERNAWHKRVRELLHPERLVFVDECGTNIALTTSYARAPRGKRAFGKAPRNWGENITLMASLSHGGITSAMTVEAATDKAAFEIYVEHFLCPTLKRRQVVIMDNLQAHKSIRVRKLIEMRGAILLFLPPYSPDFNPIEEAFSKVKSILRKEGARTKELLFEAIGRALGAISSTDALGWFKHCGYERHAQLL